MKNSITLTHMKVKGKRVEYSYEVQGEWAKYFNTEETFFAGYPFSVKKIPADILVIPFLGTILPVAWLCDAEIDVPFCDEDFYYSLPKIREGFESLYPYLRWNGTLTAEKLQKSRKKESGGSMLLFSCGVDEYTTLIRHKAERPDMCMIWGSDIPITEYKTWTLMTRKAQKTSQEFDCTPVTVRSSFRSMLNTGRLQELIKTAGDSSWNGFQHGLSLLCLAAPAAWQRGRETLYIASSSTAADVVPCGSASEIESNVRFFGAKCICDDYALTRQDKLKVIADFCSRTHVEVLPYDCPNTNNGINFGQCEKYPDGKNIYPARCFLLGVPDHSNLGDHQIVESMREFLFDIAPDMKVQEVTLTEYAEEKKNLQKLIRKDDVLILPGGGFFGNLWPRGDVLRRDVFATWPENPKIMFPQSACFTEDEEGQEFLKKSREIYKGDRTVLAFRDETSFAIAEENFGAENGNPSGENCKLFLTPDIAAWSDRRDLAGKDRKGALVILRSDQERTVTDEEQKELKRQLREEGFVITETDMSQFPQPGPASRSVRLDSMLQTIAASELVVTDRLHAMILAAITETPCVVTGNSYHKIRSFMSWMEGVSYIRFIEDPSLCGEAIREVCSVMDRSYPLLEMREKFAGFRSAVEHTLRDAGQKQKKRPDRGTPLASVVIPVYNVEKYLPVCLESVLSQSLSDMEIICVNDGSTDGSLKILEEYQKRDPRIRVISQDNAGLSAARNTGIKNAAGKYLYYLDSDDYIEPDALEKMVCRMERENLDFVLMNAVPFTEEGTDEDISDFLYRYTRTFDYPELYTGPELLKELFRNNEYQPMAWSYMTTLNLPKQNDIRFMEGILHEDNLYTFQCYLYAGRAGYMPNVFYHRRVAGGSIMTTEVTFENVRGYFLTYIEMNFSINKNNSLDESEQEAASMAASRALHNARVQYGKLSPEEKEKYKELTPQQQMLFKSLILDSVEVSQVEQDEKLRSELKKAYQEKEEQGEEIQKLKIRVDDLNMSVKKWKASQLETKDSLNEAKKDLKKTREKLEKSGRDLKAAEDTLKEVRSNSFYKALNKMKLVPRF